MNSTIKFVRPSLGVPTLLTMDLWEVPGMVWQVASLPDSFNNSAISLLSRGKCISLEALNKRNGKWRFLPFAYVIGDA